jgi:hypothetical protein
MRAGAAQVTDPQATAGHRRDGLEKPGQSGNPAGRLSARNHFKGFRVVLDQDLGIAAPVISRLIRCTVPTPRP